MTAEAEIRRRIAEHGLITFAEFMDVALYHPDGGYYTSGERVGAAGDFYTSPSVHPAFGTLLVVQFFQMWELLGRPAPFTIAEAGAGNGLLCRDIVRAAAGLPGGFARNLRYVCLDQRGNGAMLEGVYACIEDGYFVGEIADAAYRYEREVNAGRRIIVGVNEFTEGDDEETSLLSISHETEELQLKRLAQVRGDRDDDAVRASLAALIEAAGQPDANLMPPMIDAVRTYATEGEIVAALETVFGTYVETAVV